MEETNQYAQRIEEKLNDEILKRKEADAALDKLAQTRLDTVQEALVHQMQTSFKELQDDIEAAKERLGETEIKLAEVREKNERDLKAAKLELVERLDRVQAGIRAESKTRRGAFLVRSHSCLDCCWIGHRLADVLVAKHDEAYSSRAFKHVCTAARCRHPYFPLVALSLVPQVAEPKFLDCGLHSTSPEACVGHGKCVSYCVRVNRNARNQFGFV